MGPRLIDPDGSGNRCASYPASFTIVVGSEYNEIDVLLEGGKIITKQLLFVNDDDSEQGKLDLEVYVQNWIAANT